MTFIASVIAKEGIAIVADSFVTTVESSMSRNDLVGYFIKNKSLGKNNIPISDLISLFKQKASHTRNFVDKLYQFGMFSAITTTGSAYINKKEIKDIIKTIAATMQVDESAYKAKSIEDILTEVCALLKQEVIEQHKTDSVGTTEFIFSHYNLHLNEPQIFLIKIKTLDQDIPIDPNDPDIVVYEDRTHLKIVTDGQDSFVDRLIFGSFYTNVFAMKEEFLKTAIKTLKPKGKKKQEITDVIKDQDYLREFIQNDVFSVKFRQLSLQEAVDFATLLMKIVMEFQIYTEKIPTVGGLIRLATIHKERGFEWISGHKIIPPKII